jgi:hypothetical protein
MTAKGAPRHGGRKWRPGGRSSGCWGSGWPTP